MTLRQVSGVAALIAAIVLGGCAYGARDAREELSRILAARSPLPAHERFVLPAAHRAAAPELASVVVGRPSSSCAVATAANDGSLVVQHGDTLSAIAKRFYGSYAHTEQLARDNQLSNPNLIYPGQVLRLASATTQCRPDRQAALSTTAPAPTAGLSRRAFSSSSQHQPELRNILATADDRERAVHRR